MPDRINTFHQHFGASLSDLIFAFLVILFLIPIWWFPRFPSQDGPEHLYNAYLLAGWWSRPFLHSFFELNRAPVPNWFSTIFLASLLKVVPPPFAEKVLLTLWAVMLPLATRYAAGSFGVARNQLYWLSFIFIYSRFFHLGMINFCLSLAWYLIIIGYWARNRRRLRWRQVQVLCLLALLWYFTSGLSYYMAMGTVFVLSVADAIEEFKSGSFKHAFANAIKSQTSLLFVLPFSALHLALHGRNYYSSQATLLARATKNEVLWSLSRLPVLTASVDTIDLRISRVFAVLLLICFGESGITAEKTAG